MRGPGSHQIQMKMRESPARDRNSRERRSHMSLNLTLLKQDLIQRLARWRGLVREGTDSIVIFK